MDKHDLIIIGGGAAACSQPAASQIDSSRYSGRLDKVTLEIPAMVCTGCWSRVEASAGKVAGVVDVKFDENKVTRVTIVYDPAQTNPAAIITAIEKRGDRVVGSPQ